jgi:hypothetical protein
MVSGLAGENAREWLDLLQENDDVQPAAPKSQSIT